MNISLIQYDISWEEKSANLDKLDELIIPLLNKSDIVILPEMFNTGFSMNTEKLSEAPESETFEWMKNTSQKGNFGLCGSYLVQENKQ
jgi:omega-amidase